VTAPLDVRKKLTTVRGKGGNSKPFNSLPYLSTGVGGVQYPPSFRTFLPVSHAQIFQLRTFFLGRAVLKRKEHLPGVANATFPIPLLSIIFPPSLSTRTNERGEVPLTYPRHSPRPSSRVENLTSSRPIVRGAHDAPSCIPTIRARAPMNVCPKPATVCSFSVP